MELVVLLLELDGLLCLAVENGLETLAVLLENVDIFL